MKTNPRIRRRLATVIAACAIALGTVSPAGAQDQTGGVPGDWLSSYNSARTIGMGGAVVAGRAHPLMSAWNPAGLSMLDQNEVALETARLFEGTSLYGASFAMPARTLPSVGITILSLNSGDFQRTNELNEDLGAFGESDLALLLTASKMITPKFSVGTNLKVVRQSVEEFGATGVGFDLGAVYDVTPSLRAGASMLNIGGPGLKHRDVDESFPTEFRGGLGWFLLNGRGLVSAEVDHRDGTGASLHLGSEFALYRSLSVRLGLNGSEPGGGLSYQFDNGLGVHYGLTEQELGATHRMGISYKFGGFYASSDAHPDIFSPLGQQAVTRINLSARTKVEASEWTLRIEDADGAEVRRFGGRGTPPSHVMWDGKSDQGLPLPDGTYSYELVVLDAEGRTLSGSPRDLVISTGGPQGGIEVDVSSVEKPR